MLVLPYHYGTLTPNFGYRESSSCYTLRPSPASSKIVVCLWQLNLSVKSGQIMPLAGPEGAGKTSFLCIIAGFAMPDVGEVLW
ncbi:hypothetical protein CWC25_22470, partial [Pseudoalteromonas sp. S4389]